ncbi:phage terminase large subunit family protein [Desulfosarcina sp. OttesenSCG-928-G10]|nr:phage terminase large subunit family protein [Desulfosarcina sp. OttesenSCG-928-G10]
MAMRNQKISCAKIPLWLPSWLVEKCGGKIRATFRFSAGERMVMHKRRPETPSTWAERHRVLRMSSIPGKWRHTFTPYIAPLMDAARFPGIETIILCKVPQSAGSEAGFNLLGHAVDHAPGPAMVVFPDKDTAKDNARDRLLPMFEDSPRLRRHLTGAANDETSIRINLRHMAIFLGWSGSVSRLGNRPIRTLILDELDKYQDSRKEARSEDLAEKRTTTWRGRRLVVKISTPTVETGPIWKAFSEEAHARFDWWVTCPACGGFQLMAFDNIRWPETERDPEVVLRDTLSWYQCAHCEARWTEAMRDMAVRKGQWVERESGLELFTHLKTHRQSKLGFHIPAWISHFVSFSEIAAAFLRWEKTKKLNDLKNFMNQYKAEPWQERFAEREEDAILALCDTRPRGVVPVPEEHSESGRQRPPVAALLAAIDTQGKYFRYVIRAFAYGPSEESWLIQCGSLGDFEDIVTVLWKSVYLDGNGRELRVRNTIIDAMGNRTKKVYEFCVAHRGRIVPYQGVDRLSEPIKLSPQEYFPDDRGNKIKIPGGLLLHRVHTKFFKDDLAARLSIAPDDPGAFHLHANDRGELVEYARELCAEVWSDEEQAWINPHQRPNHYWDCEVMLQALAWQLRISKWKIPSDAAKPKTVGLPSSPRVRGQRMTPGERIAAVRG